MRGAITALFVDGVDFFVARRPPTGQPFDISVYIGYTADSFSDRSAEGVYRIGRAVRTELLLPLATSSLLFRTKCWPMLQPSIFPKDAEWTTESRAYRDVKTNSYGVIS